MIIAEKVFKIDEVFEIKKGYTPDLHKSEYWEGGTIPFFKIDDIRQKGTILRDAQRHVTHKGVNKKGTFPAYSILYAYKLTTGVHALVKTECIASELFVNFAIREEFQNKLLPKYVYYYFYHLDTWGKHNLKPGFYDEVDLERLKKEPFPIISIKDQEEIIKTFDILETHSCTLGQGLLKELEEIRNKYDIMRTVLLDFSDQQKQTKK